MQIKTKDYNPELHDKFRALSVKQPYADSIKKGLKTIELRTRNTSYRGDLVICSTGEDFESLPKKCTICKVELYDVVRVADMTDEEKALTCLPLNHPYWDKAKFGWKLRNERELIEFPVKGNLGIWPLIYTKDVIIEQPIYVTFGKKKRTIN